MSAAMLPCPFCDSIALTVRTNDRRSRVTCDTCGAFGPVSIFGEERAPILWNKRPLKAAGLPGDTLTTLPPGWTTKRIINTSRIGAYRNDVLQDHFASYIEAETFIDLESKR